MAPPAFHALRKRLASVASRNWERPHWRILYYHDIPAEKVDVFKAQIAWFSERFTWCSMSEGVQALRDGTLTRPLISLTFDDGDLSLHDIVIPALADMNIRACAYIVPTYVERGKSYRDPSPRPIMSWNMIREWLDAGHEVGSHTYTHAPMNRCTVERMEQEAAWSKQALEDKLQTTIAHFSYPWGQCDSTTHEVLHAGGLYDSVATIYRGPMGPHQDLLALRRDRCQLDMSIEDIETVMRLADRLYWLRHLRLLAPARTQEDRKELWGPLSDSERG